MLPNFPTLTHRTRASILALLLVVLPLHSVVQLVAGLQGHRHVHTGSGSVLASLAIPVRALLDRLHADQDTRLAKSQPSRAVSGELHAHGDVLHRHADDTTDVLEVGDPAEDSAEAGTTAFLAWLPLAVTLLSDAGRDHPAGAGVGWRDRVVAPPLTPPRA